jgi:hypothetical protein
MKEFVLLFRRPELKDFNYDSQQIESYRKKWNDWVNGFSAEVNQSTIGYGLAEEGKVLKPSGVITDGPFVEIKEKLGGFAIVKAESLEEATTLAHGCPVLDIGGSVEIRSAFLIKGSDQAW